MEEVADESHDYLFEAMRKVISFKVPSVPTLNIHFLQSCHSFSIRLRAAFYCSVVWWYKLDNKASKENENHRRNEKKNLVDRNSFAIFSSSSEIVKVEI